MENKDIINSVLSGLVLDIETQISKLEDSMKELNNWLVFRNFEEDDEPTIKYENDIIVLKWHNKILTITDVMSLMKEVGYITKNSFRVKI